LNPKRKPRLKGRWGKRLSIAVLVLVVVGMGWLFVSLALEQTRVYDVSVGDLYRNSLGEVDYAGEGSAIPYWRYNANRRVRVSGTVTMDSSMPTERWRRDLFNETTSAHVCFFAFEAFDPLSNTPRRVSVWLTEYKSFRKGDQIEVEGVVKYTLLEGTLTYINEPYLLATRATKIS